MSKKRWQKLRFALFVGWFIFILIAPGVAPFGSIATLNLSTIWSQNLQLQAAEVQRQKIDLSQADTLPESDFEQEFRVSPQDPGYVAIRYLNNRYGCMSTYPDGRLAPRVDLIRSELVVDLNVCLERGQEIIAARLSKFAKKKQIVSVKSLLNSMANDIQQLKRKSYVSK